MTISLRIDNPGALAGNLPGDLSGNPPGNWPGAGPHDHRSTARRLTIGRGEACDVTLPDPSRVVSGTHCEVSFDAGTYWLLDMSTNGTFLNGALQRMQGPHRLATGDRIGIGPYVLSVEIDSSAAIDAEAEQVAFAASSDSGARIISPAEETPRGTRPVLAQIFHGEHDQHDDVGSFGDLDRFGEREDLHAPASVPEPPGAVFPAQDASFAGAVTEMPSFENAARAYLPYPGSTDGGDAEFLRRFALGAGIDPFVLSTADPGDTAEEIGRVMRIVIDDVQQLLKARQAAKILARSAKRTTLGRVNNPLKFLPNPDDVLEILFTGRRSGYLAAVEAFEEAFGDLKRHELATYAAMQAALSRLLEDLSPETIEDNVTASAFASRKSRNWEMYVARWEAKTEPHEQGMLGAFLTYFAEAYDEKQHGL